MKVRTEVNFLLEDNEFEPQSTGNIQATMTAETFSPCGAYYFTKSTHGGQHDHHA